jgi:hypothetical protein
VRAVHASARLARHTITSIFEAVLIVAIVASLVMAYAVVTHQSPAGADQVFAGGKAGGGGGGGGGKGGKPGGGSGSGSLQLVMVDDANGSGAPNWHDTITFNVTASTSTPSVNVACYQGGKLVYSAFAGFYDSYPWPAARWMALYSPSWTGGAASCTAALETGGSLSFNVGA